MKSVLIALLGFFALIGLVTFTFGMWVLTACIKDSIEQENQTIINQ